MPTFRTAGRSLFLLALFHLAGGPAVLCGVFLLAKLAGSPAPPLPEHRANASCLARTEPSLAFQACFNDADSLPAEARSWGSDTAPAKPALPKPRTGKGSKGKFVGFAETEILSIPLEPSGKLPAMEDPESLVSHGGLPPPLPPPRWV